MSETSPEPAVAPEADDDTTPQSGEPFDPARAEARIRKANSEARNLRERLRQLEPLAAEAEKLKQAQMSEAEKVTARMAELERTASDATSEVARLRVALRHGVAEEDMELLGTGTEEQIEARAKRLAELRGAAQPAAPASPFGSRPVEQLRPGATPSQPDQPNPTGAINSWIRKGVGLPTT